MTDTDSSRVEDFQRFTERFFWLLVVSGPDGEIRVSPAYRGLFPRQDVMCADHDPEVRRSLDLAAAAACLSNEDPDFALDTLHREALDEVRARIAAGRFVSGLPVDDRAFAELRAEAEAVLRASLRGRRVYERLADSWNRNVARESACYRRFEQKRQEERRGFFESGGSCRAWPRLVDVCSHPGKALSGHVVRHPDRPGVDVDQERAASALWDRNLAMCLANLIEHGPDGSLAERVRQFDLLTPTEEAHRIRRDVWSLWRQNGVERWLEATAEAGGVVPEEVAAALDRCTETRVPATITDRMREGP